MNGPKIWNKLLSESPKDSILMGGAIVDYAIGVEPKDYDVFYPYHFGQHKDPPPNWKMTNADFNDPEWVKEHDAWYLQGQGDGIEPPPIQSVIEYLVDGEHIVQLIGVWYKDPIQHFRNFDHSMTLAKYSSNGLFVHRKVFESMENKTIEFIGKNKSIESRDRSLKRAKQKILRYSEQGALAPIAIAEWGFKGF